MSASAFAGVVAGRVPDLLEPAARTTHRVIFRSIGVIALVGYGTHRAYRWEPADDVERLIRCLALVGGLAYLGHLGLDARTLNGLPLA